MEAENASSFLEGPAPTPDDNIVRKIQQAHPTVFLACLKNKNKNVAVYEVLHKDGKLCNPPITGYCLVLDPGADYQAKRRAQGIAHDRSPFNVMDLKYAWGYESKRLSDTQAEFWFTQKPDKKFTVTLLNRQAKMSIMKDGRKYLLNQMYVKINDTFHLLDPTRNVEELYFQGLDVTAKPPKPVKLNWK